MNYLRLAAFAALAFAASAASAQSAPSACPTLPADSGLRWESMDGPGFVFCRALRDTDQSEAFAVTISRDSPFRPSRGDRAEQASIAGQQGYWYRSQIASAPGTIAREALVEVDAQHVAHISFRAASQADMARNQQLVQALRFDDARLTSN